MPKRSKYRPLSSFRFLTQYDYLYCGGIDNDNDERKIEIRDIMDRENSLFMYNPLEEGCFLSSITRGKSKQFILITT